MRDRLGSKRLEELDALRGIAALAVVLFHFSRWSPYPGSVFDYGVTGVDLFFMISGYVILMTLEHTESAKHFLVGRFSRLYPAYWVSVTFTTAIVFLHVRLAPETVSVTLSRYTANMTMFQYYLHQADIDGAYWTLTLELSFYGIMLGLYLIKALPYLEILGALTLPFAFLFRSAYFKAEWLPQHDFLINHFPIVCFYPLFLAGILFHRIHSRGHDWRRYALLAFCFAAQSALLWEGGISRYVVNRWEYSGMLAIYFLLFFLFVNRRLGFLVNGVTLFLGKISFSLYLCHQYAGVWFFVPYLRTRGIPYWPAAGLGLAAVFLVAILITRYVEIPAMGFIRSRYARRAGRVLVASAATRLDGP